MRNPARADRPAPPDGPAAPRAPLLAEPAGGIPEVISSSRRLIAYATALAADREPVAVDAERASGYRYSQRAYLVQLKSRAAGIGLIDPVPFRHPPTLAKALAGREWVLHAATQDLPCLAEIGLRPDALFDTELSARLLGMDRVGLGAVVEDTLGVRLQKEHSAVDWSRRPLPRDWLVYAALDVEVLLDVRDVLAGRLREAGKWEFARQEFDFLVHRWTPPAPKEEGWRRLPGIARARSARALGIARDLWELRDEIAREKDVSPHRVMSDKALAALVLARPTTPNEFRLAFPRGAKDAERWRERFRAALRIPPTHLPEHATPAAVPDQRSWARKHPERAERLVAAKEAVGAVAQQLDMPAENVLTPAHLRELVWTHPQGADRDTVRAALTASGSRPWQIEQVLEPLSGVMGVHPGQ